MTPDKSEIRKADPPFDDQEADVIIRTSDNVDFYVCKSFLAYSSSVFKDMFCVAQGSPKNDELKNDLQIIPTDESAETWGVLLRFSYPSWAVGPPALKSLDEFSKALESSRKYGMTGAEKLIVADLIAPRFLDKDPMRVFALACRFRLDAEARLAAKQSLHVPLLGRPFFVEMESMTMRTYHLLVQYHLQCGKVASGVVEDTTWISDLSPVWFNAKWHEVCGKEVREIKNQRVATWWYDYMQSAAKVLENRPVGAMVLDSDLMDSALERANRCSGCAPRAFVEMRAFGKAFAAKVDEEVAKVVLDIQF